jgi:hypothetical protein
LVLVYHNYHTNNKIVPTKLSHEEAVKAFKIDSKEGARAVKMDSLGKIDSKENELPGRTGDEKRRAAGKADGRVK